jgi:hypothetical protein
MNMLAITSADTAAETLKIFRIRVLPGIQTFASYHYMRIMETFTALRNCTPLDQTKALRDLGR